MCAKAVQQPEMPTYFEKRKGSANWRVRMVAPQHLHPYLENPEFRRSTRTPDSRKAQIIGTPWIAEQLQAWADLESSLRLSESPASSVHLSDSLVAEICDRRLASWLKSDEDERYGPEGIADSEFDELCKFCELTDAAMRSAIARGPASAQWGHVVDSVLDWCFTIGYDIDTTDPMFTNLVRSFAAAEKLAMAKLSARNSGDVVATPEAPLSGGISSPAAHPIGAKGEMSALTEPYREHKSKTVGSKSVSKNVSIWNRFVDYMQDAPLNSITAKNIYDFLDSRLNADDGPWSMGYAHGPACTALNEVFAYARTMGLMTAPNPVLNLEVKPTISKAQNARRTNPRRPFTTEQINTIYASKWYDPNARDWKGKMGQDLAGRYWPPLITNLHGLRGVEALQLVAGDFDLQGPVPLVTFQIDLAIEIDAKDLSDVSAVDAESLAIPQRSHKNEQTRRTLPIHPQLVKLGLVEFVKARLAFGVNTPLFDSSLPEPGGVNPQWGRAYTQRFLPFVRDTLKFGKGYGNHSWRHKFEDALRDANIQHGTWPAGVPQLVSGRKKPRKVDNEIFREVGSEDDYGDGYDPASILKYIEQLTFPGVVFPPPFAEWIAKAIPLQRNGSKRAGRTRDN